MWPITSPTRNRQGPVFKPRPLLILAIVLVALAGGLAAHEYGRLTRSFFSQAALSEGRAVRDRLNLALSAPLSAQSLTGRLLSQAGPGAFEPEKIRKLLVSTLAHEQTLGSAVVLDGQGVFVLASRTPDGLTAYVRGDGGGARLQVTSDGALPGSQPGRSIPVSKDQLEELGRILGDSVKNHSGGWPVWTVRHFVPGQSSPSLSAVVPAGYAGYAGQAASTEPNGQAGQAGGEPGIQGGQAGTNEPYGETTRFLAFGFELDALWRVLSQDAPEGAKILVFTPDGHLLDPVRPREQAPGSGNDDPAGTGRGSGRDSGQADGKAAPAGSPAPLYVTSEQSGDPTLRGAMEAWLQSGRPSQEAFAFQADGRTWWAALSPLSEDADRTCVGLALAQDDLLALTLGGRRAPLAIGAGLGLALALLVTLAARSRRRGKSAVGGFYENEEEIRKLLDKGESERLEFKSTLRFNLAAGKPGKEIELASLKTLTAFMNTDGGVLAVGVDDQGRALGLGADGFENDDHALRHFSSLFAQHIGVEFLPFVTFALRELEGRKVLLAECRKSDKPVILKGGKEEEFYVRAGPSSRKLSLSEFMRRMSG